MDHRTTILHLYRSLLRSASYLPDSLARLRIYNEIVHRFHQRQRSHKHALPSTSHKTISILQKQATKLQRAADWHADNLTSILMFTYGRRGTRRRMLMSELLAAPNQDVPSDANSLETFISQSAQKGEKPGHASNAKLVALLKSQKENASHVDNAKIKDWKPKIPEQNIWMRKTPVKVRANLEKKFWAKTLGKVCPPLEGEEWERLRQLAKGQLVEEKPLRRKRCTAVIDHTEVASEAPELEGWMQRIHGSREKSEILSSRGLRRLYSLIWTQAPLMALDPASKKWKAEWGRESTLSKAGIEAVPRARQNHLELFEGTESLDAGFGKNKKKQSEKKQPKQDEEQLEGNKNLD